MYYVLWLVPFNLKKCPKPDNARIYNIFNKAYFTDQASKVLGDVYCVADGKFKFCISSSANTLLDIYLKRQKLNLNINIKKINKIINSSRCKFEIYILKKWSIGIILLMFPINEYLTTDELILLIRTFRRSLKKMTILTISGFESYPAMRALIEFLRDHIDMYKMRINNYMYNIYYFIFIDNGVRTRYSKREIHGIFTRTLNYNISSNSDIKKLCENIIEMKANEHLYIGPYSGGAFVNTRSRKVILFYTNLILYLISIKYILKSLYINTADIISKNKYKIKEIRLLTYKINNALLCITPYTISESYKFNNELLPKFIKVTKLDQMVEQLEKLLRSLDDMLYRKYNERIQILLAILTFISLILIFLQTLEYLLLI